MFWIMPLLLTGVTVLVFRPPDGIVLFLPALFAAFGSAASNGVWAARNRPPYQGPRGDLLAWNNIGLPGSMIRRQVLRVYLYVVGPLAFLIWNAPPEQGPPAGPAHATQWILVTGLATLGHGYVFGWLRDGPDLSGKMQAVLVGTALVLSIAYSYFT